MLKNTHKKSSRNFFKHLTQTSVLAVIFISFLGCKDVDLKQVSDAIGSQSVLDQKTVAAGLKQALEIGTKNTVAKTSSKGGFSNNPLIKIAVPEKMDKLAKNMRRFGLGSYVDQFEMQMNRSAEVASAEAKTVFINSISQMSINDAWGILNGADNAATDYFKRTTSAQLTQKFKPIITQSMQKVGFYSDYKNLLNKYNALPFTQKPDLNIENYILDKTLSGVFTLVAEEELKIRKNPSARVTDLLKRVFGR